LSAATETPETRRTLEEWDDHAGRWVLYRNEAAHTEDCQRFPYDAVPSTIFLDTSVVNLLVKFSGTIFEHEPIPTNIPQERAFDIEALMHLMRIGARANWIVTTSPRALQELANTRDAGLRELLVSYGREFLFTHNEGYGHSTDLGRKSIDAPFLSKLPDAADRELIGNAVGLGCEVFCTADRTTIIRFREALIGVPIRIMTPIEWWRQFKPWAGLLL